MPTNTTEYQREYQKEYRKTHPQKQYKKSKEVKKEVKKVKKVKVFDLHPPRAPVKVEKPVEAVQRGLEPKPAVVRGTSQHGSNTIDFSYLTNNSSFQRAIMEFIRKFVPGLENLKVRANKEVMKQSFNENANNYRNVMKELKEVLKKRNE